jgi:hypothetical protein
MSKNSRARAFCALGGLKDLVTKNLDFLVKLVFLQKHTNMHNLSKN